MFSTHREQLQHDEYLELVAEYMQAGMSQDDAEIEAANELEQREELRAFDNMRPEADE